MQQITWRICLQLKFTQWSVLSEHILVSVAAHVDDEKHTMAWDSALYYANGCTKGQSLSQSYNNAVCRE